ncbi:MAG: hypothetical protein PHC34_00505 [Candidatus Gastranaerophilales bacterium]|nr:hypothetical protein [Candidatus Gastranaerophilales bacterium]
MAKITLRSDRDTDYNFTYKGEEKILQAGSVIDIADGLTDVVLPTCVMKIIRGVIVIKEDSK